VGAFNAGPFMGEYGAAYVLFGGGGTFSASIDVSDLNGSTGFRLKGALGDYAGFSVSSAGDVNGDGFDDVIVNAYGADSDAKNSGSVYVVSNTAGFPRASTCCAHGTDGFRLDGAANDWAGNSVSSAGDVNGDGFADLIIAAKFADPVGPIRRCVCPVRHD
jgi:hypothetical protein